uniref:Uncharacterized protein n=1 Tax=Chlorocebus sabaeus TaxID=60711 RepID=A0A0D9RXF0_CHLSB
MGTDQLMVKCTGETEAQLRCPPSVELGQQQRKLGLQALLGLRILPADTQAEERELSAPKKDSPVRQAHRCLEDLL